MGLVIFSLSEIVLFLGEAWTIRWLKNLNHLLTPSPGSTSVASSAVVGSEKTDPIASVILLLHTSLHQHTSQSEVEVSPLSLPPSCSGSFPSDSF
jgi:hypothetical protein